jgi:hypothetical protein
MAGPDLHLARLRNTLSRPTSLTPRSGRGASPRDIQELASGTCLDFVHLLNVLETLLIAYSTYLCCGIVGSQVVLSGFNGLGEPYKSFVTFFRHLVPAIDTDTVSAARYCQLWNLMPLFVHY